MFEIGGMILVAAAAHLEHFGAGDTFGIRQVGIRNQSAAQRD